MRGCPEMAEPVQGRRSLPVSLAVFKDSSCTGPGDAGEGGDAPQHPHRHHGRAAQPGRRAQQRPHEAPRKALGALRRAGRLSALPRIRLWRLGRYTLSKLVSCMQSGIFKSCCTVSGPPR